MVDSGWVKLKRVAAEEDNSSETSPLTSPATEP